MVWLVFRSVRRNLGRHWLALVGLACAVALSSLGMSGAGIMLRLARRPMTQLLGGDIMIVDSSVVFESGPGASIQSDDDFTLFSLTPVVHDVAASLPGTSTTATMTAPCLDSDGRISYLLGRLDDTRDPMYFYDILHGERPKPGLSPFGILVPGNGGGSRFGEVGDELTLRLPRFWMDQSGKNLDLAAGKAATFQITGIHDENWASGYMYIQLSDLYTLLGTEGLANWAAVAVPHVNPFDLDGVAQTLEQRFRESGRALQAITADDFARLTVADFDRFRQTAAFYATAIVLVSVLIVIASSLSSARSRRRELAMLRAIGLSANQLRRFFVYESTLIAVTGAAIGYLGSVLAASSLMGGAYTTPLPAFITVAVTAVVATASSSAVGQSAVAEVLRNP